MIGHALKCSTKTEDIVADMFGGSGTTLIACEKWGRSARIMELDAEHCTAIKIRFESLTGIQGLLIDTV